jgi:hypothetical protein
MAKVIVALWLTWMYLRRHVGLFANKHQLVHSFGARVAVADSAYCGAAHSEQDHKL